LAWIFARDGEFLIACTRMIMFLGIIQAYSTAKSLFGPGGSSDCTTVTCECTQSNQRTYMDKIWSLGGMTWKYVSAQLSILTTQ
jgi:hypothetical protein